MNETRKKIIIHEIKYWKQSQLLPEHYCDFLLTLYSGGEEEITPLEQKKATSLHIPLWMFTVIFFSTLFVNYFTEIPMGLQITLTAVAIMLFGYFIYRYMNHTLLSQLAIVGLALLVLVESVTVADVLFPKSNMALSIILLLQCVLWFIVGLKFKLIYFSISGVLGALLIFYFLARLFFL